jgi:signal peptidase I
MKNHFIKILLTCLVLLTIVYLTSPYRIIVVQGISMSPTFQNKQILVAKSINNYQDIKINDILVCELEDNTIVKRVKYLENQIIYYYIDSNTSEIKLIDKNTYQYLSTHPIIRNKSLIQKVIIPKNSIYLLGDNLNNSDDSRRFGPISFNNIKYKIIYPGGHHE